MTPQSFNMHRFEHSIVLDTRKDILFHCIASGDGLGKWFLGNAEFIHEGNIIDPAIHPVSGDFYQWQWLAKSFSSKGKVIEIKDGESVAYTFGPEFKVRFHISAVGNRYKLQLIQTVETDISSDPFGYFNCCVCWVFFLTNLKSVLENKIDLREKEIDDEVLVNR